MHCIMYALERKGLRDTSAVQAVVSKTLSRGLPLFFKNAVLGLELERFSYDLEMKTRKQNKKNK